MTDSEAGRETDVMDLHHEKAQPTISFSCDPGSNVNLAKDLT
jgi:hypothetical protein